MTVSDTTPVIGWERETPAPDHRFSGDLEARGGRLHLDGLDLAGLLLDGIPGTELGPLPSPLEIVYLPLIRRRIAGMTRCFEEVGAELGYTGRFHYAYASKANAAEEVVRTTLGAGAHHEMSSAVDVDIALRMADRGLLPPDRMVIANGFKPPGSAYCAELLRLRERHDRVIPVLEDVDELAPLVDCGRPFDVGLRQKCYGDHRSQAEIDAADSRFGMRTDQLWEAAERIEAAPGLTLRLYHFMVGSQMMGRADFIGRLRVGMELYAQLRRRFPSLSVFNFGGGVPARMTLDQTFDRPAFARTLLSTLQRVCAGAGVPEPDVMGEFGRYTTAEHGAHLFRVVAVKDNGSALPWYLVDGSIMASFPDSWALGEHFTVLPLTHLDRPFRRVRLGGITCDSDDVYPPHGSEAPLYLPVDTDGLYVGFFSVGAYQEMLGGVRGSKHCVLPEAHELIVDRDGADGPWRFELLAGQTPGDVMRNLGYRPDGAAQ